MSTPWAHGSHKWMHQRRNTVCSSEMGALLGLDMQRSRRKVMQCKETGVEPPLCEFASRMCEVGILYEPVALKAVEPLFPYPLSYLGHLLYAGADCHKFQGTPDAVTMDEYGNWIPVEVKTRAFPNELLALPYQSKYDVPEKHWIQLISYMLLLNSPCGFLVSHSPCHGTFIYKAYYSHVIVKKFLIPMVYRFNEGMIDSQARIEYKEKKQLLDSLTDWVHGQVNLERQLPHQPIP
jgi:hypothetical protein